MSFITDFARNLSTCFALFFITEKGEIQQIGESAGAVAEIAILALGYAAFALSIQFWIDYAIDRKGRK